MSFILILALIVQTSICLTFLISSIREKEKLATIFGGLQFFSMLGLLILFIYWWVTGFFETGIGRALLILGIIFGAVLVSLLFRKTGQNPRAIEGTKGLIVERVARRDERDIVFARSRTIRLGSEQYKSFYEMRPEYRAFDDTRREKGGPLGHPGAIDRSNDRPNVAATMASLSIPLHLSTTEKFKPQAHPEFQGQRVDFDAVAASERVKGYIRSLGADLVGITEIQTSSKLGSISGSKIN